MKIQCYSALPLFKHPQTSRKVRKPTRAREKLSDRRGSTYVLPPSDRATFPASVQPDIVKNREKRVELELELAKRKLEAIAKVRSRSISASVYAGVVQPEDRKLNDASLAINHIIYHHL